jgi:long-subunit acyl-CoA synthetase (AMP-forming)|tara:strand:- start:1155 stop:1481 length:327 start_codon:yes stop_codon:yes gene_type:complete
MTTMLVSKDYVTGLAKLKSDDTASGEEKLVHLANIVVIETDVSAEARLAVTEAGMKLYTLEDLYKKGVEVAASSSCKEPTSDTCSAFSYTSGTTGDPKGVKLTHGMLL